MGDKTNRDKLRREQALEYHAGGRPGKIEVVPTKEAKTQKDLSLAYSPGVAIPCTEIKNNPADVFSVSVPGKYSVRPDSDLREIHPADIFAPCVAGKNSGIGIGDS